jgi:hypothetical protein
VLRGELARVRERLRAVVGVVPTSHDDDRTLAVNRRGTAFELTFDRVSRCRPKSTAIGSRIGADDLRSSGTNQDPMACRGRPDSRRRR